MDQRLMCHFEVKKNDHTYTFSFPHGVTVGELLDVCFEMLEGAQNLSNKAIEQSKRAPEPVAPEPS